MAAKYRTSKCPSCGESATKQGRDTLCWDCERLITIGRHHVENVEDGNVTIATIDDHFVYGMYQPDHMPERFYGSKLVSLLAKLAGGRDSQAFQYYHATEHLGGGERDATIQSWTYEIPTNKIGALKEVIDAIYRLMAWTRAESVSHGQNVLLQLASGEMSPDDFNNFEKHYLVRGKHQKSKMK